MTCLRIVWLRASPVPRPLCLPLRRLRGGQCEACADVDESGGARLIDGKPCAIYLVRGGSPGRTVVSDGRHAGPLPNLYNEPYSASAQHVNPLAGSYEVRARQPVGRRHAWHIVACTK